MSSEYKTLKELLPAVARKNPSLAPLKVISRQTVDGVLLVIFEPNHPPNLNVTLFNNLFGFAADGTLKWQIEVTAKNPTANNHVTNLWKEADGIHVGFWVGFEGLLDANTGEWKPLKTDARAW